MDKMRAMMTLKRVNLNLLRGCRSIYTTPIVKYWLYPSGGLFVVVYTICRKVCISVVYPLTNGT